MNNIQALILYVFVALIALLGGVFLNVDVGWTTFFTLFLLATVFIILRRQLANPLDLE